MFRDHVGQPCSPTHKEPQVANGDLNSFCDTDDSTIDQDELSRLPDSSDPHLPSRVSSHEVNHNLSPTEIRPGDIMLRELTTSTLTTSFQPGKLDAYLAVGSGGLRRSSIKCDQASRRLHGTIEILL
jgi:hypothetical protein